MSEASEEITMPMPDVPPQENPRPDPNYSFYLKMKPFDTLKHAIEALLHPYFNNDGFGMVGAASDSLAISVKDNDNATATLLMKSSGTIEFHNYALPPLMVELLAPLRLISQGFPRYLNDGDDDNVVIFHVKGTDRLHFEFGTFPRTGIWAKIVEIPCVTMFPNLTVLSAITVPVDDIRAMSDYMLLARKNDAVFVDWKEDFATFGIGSNRRWEYELKEPTGLKPGQTIQAWFSWSYTRFVREACFLADKVRVHFLSVPEQHILFQFHIGESADLFLLEKARLLISDMSAAEGARDEDFSDSVTLDTLSNAWLH